MGKITKKKISHLVKSGSIKIIKKNKAKDYLKVVVIKLEGVKRKIIIIGN